MIFESLAIELVLRVVFGGLCAVVASGRGRSGVAWFFLGFFLGCVGLIVLLVIPDLRLEQERRSKILNQNRRLREQVRKDRMVADARSGEQDRRLQAHDRALGIDTAPPAPDVLESGSSQPRWQVAGPSVAPADSTAPPSSGQAGRSEAAPGTSTPSDHEDRAWYFADHQGRQGPVSLTILRTLWAQGVVTGQTYVWAEGMGDWASIAQVAGLEDMLDVA